MSSLLPQSKELMLRAMAVMAEYDAICVRQDAETAALEIAHQRAREAYFLKADKSGGRVSALEKEPLDLVVT